MVSDGSHSRKVDIAACVRRVPDKTGLLLLAWIRVRHGTALGVCLRVGCLRPGADPLVRIGITRLQKESLERGARDAH